MFIYRYTDVINCHDENIPYERWLTRDHHIDRIFLERCDNNISKIDFLINNESSSRKIKLSLFSEYTLHDTRKVCGNFYVKIIPHKHATDEYISDIVFNLLKNLYIRQSQVNLYKIKEEYTECGNHSIKTYYFIEICIGAIRMLRFDNKCLSIIYNEMTLNYK